MSRKPNIRWRKSDAERLEAEIKRFNAKIYRARKKSPELVGILPSTIKKADKQAMIENLKSKPRSEFNKELKSMDRFSRKGAEKPITSKTGNTVTRWEKNETGLKVAQINRARTLERKKYEDMDVTSRGVSIGMKRGEMGSERMDELRPKKFNFDKIRKGKEWEKFKETVDKQASHTARHELMEEYKQNYIKGLLDNFGSHADDIVDMVQFLPAEEIVETFFSEQEATIDFMYDKIDMDIKLEIMGRIWADKISSAWQ